MKLHILGVWQMPIMKFIRQLAHTVVMTKKTLR